MKIKVNGKDQTLSKNNVNVTEMLTIAKVENPNMVSVQLNGEFVKKEKFASIKLKEGDEIDFLYFMGGGRK